MKRVYSILFTIVMIVSLACQCFAMTPTETDNEKIFDPSWVKTNSYVVAATSLKLKTSPNSSKVICYIPRGKTIIGLGENRDGYLKVYYNGQIGFCGARWCVQDQSFGYHTKKVVTKKTVLWADSKCTTKVTTLNKGAVIQEIGPALKVKGSKDKILQVKINGVKKYGFIKETKNLKNKK